ncbi:MAG: hypothetical protein HYR79_08230 [Nitrospirae bacterium]|nr:hypothetical protein [Nitrospirota bacterium]
MLNELYDAARSLEAAGISPPDWHKEYVPVRAPKLAFFVYIDQQGEITAIERVGDKADVADLRTWESKGDLRQSFPYFNIPPLLWIEFDPEQNEDDKSIKKALKANKLTREQLVQLLEKTRNDEPTKKWQENFRNKIGKCLDKGRVLKSVLGEAPQMYQSIIELIDRLENTSAEDLYNKLFKTLKDKMLTQPKAAGKYFDGLFSWSEEGPGNDVTLFLELVDGASRFEYPVKNKSVRDWINDRLLSQVENRGASSPTLDIFGNHSVGWELTFDDVRMKNTLGIVKLRAMASAAVCQYRYGKADAESCRVGQESRRKMKGALEWLTDPSHKGKTWDTVARAADNKEILLSYPSMLPPEPPDIAIMFGGALESDTDNTGRFENCAQNVTGSLRGLMAKNPNLDIRVFVLRKMDTARTRVSNHRRYSAQHLIDSAKNWQMGCRNLPRILIKQFVHGGGRPEWREAQTPFPMEVVWMLNTFWSRGMKGTTKGKGQPQWSPIAVKDIAAEDGISLLLEEGVFLQPILHHALYGATRNGVGLVLALGQAHAQDQVFTTDKNYARQAVILPSLLGILLFKINITKEDYMKSPPYLIGRLLSLADQLHYHYCQHVRKNSIPPQLMGNALMPTALEEPVKALALYSNRILPYQAWAKTVSGDPVGLARYFLSELGKTCSEVSLSKISERCTDADKAQMLIGYLARTEKTDSETKQKGE